MLNTTAGRSVPRVDGRPKVTGTAAFTADHAPAGVAHGYLVTSTAACGALNTVRTEAAAAAAGVLAVYSLGDLPMFPPKLPIIWALGDGRRPLQDPEIRFYGQPVAIVLAESFEQARDAAGLVEVSYYAKPPRASFRDAIPHAVDPPPPPPEYGQPVLILEDGVAGIDEALAASEVTLERTYTQPGQHHNAIEAHAAVAQWHEDRLIIHSSTQGPVLHSMEIADALGVGPEQVRVICPYVGGAFGGKATTWAHSLLAAAAARVLGRPVKLVVTREQLFTVTGHRSPVYQEIALGARRDGTLTAIKHHCVSELPMENPSDSALLAYRSPNLSLQLRLVAPNTPKSTIMRAPGHSPGSFALECAMDELAEQLGVDPIELRMRNYLTHAPTTGLPYSSKHLDECYRMGAERFGWAGRNPVPRSHADGEWLVGTGMAAGVLPAERQMAAIRVRFSRDGTAQVATSTSDLGTGALTMLATFGANELGIPVARIAPALGDSGLPRHPGAMPSWLGAVMSSTTATIAASVGPAARAAVAALTEHAVQHAESPFHGMDRAKVSYREGQLTDGRTAISFGDLLTMTRTDGIEALYVDGGRQPEHAFASYAVFFCETRVNRWTGEPRVARMTTVVDAGAIVNQATARNQLNGGVIMGIGHALLEEVHFEPSGRIANGNLADYLVPVNADVPDLDLVFLDYPDLNFVPAGVRGIGEIGCVGSAAAIANAIYHATGKRIRDLPITADKLFE